MKKNLDQTSVQYVKGVGIALRALRTAIAIVVACVFFFYPAIVCLKLTSDTAFKKGEVPAYAIDHFVDISIRFEKWAINYVRSQQAAKVDPEDCAATEWPMFGSVYYLLGAEEIQKIINNQNNFSTGRIRQVLGRASEAAAQIISDPTTGTWTKQKWGESYLKKENVFYRMLLILGLSSYENITKNRNYRLLLKEQSQSLAAELKKAPYYMLDDYPGECYPNDVLWAVAAILRSDRILKTDHSFLKNNLVNALSSRSITKEGLPAYAVDKKTGLPVSPARGCSNSGILIFTPELNKKVAKQWYNQHEKYFWEDYGFLKGFREFTQDHPHGSRDVDTGPIIGGLGSVASLFGIGAARSVGRLDHSVPLTMEFIALSWPTPFGLLLPSFFSYIATGSTCLGDVTMIFLVTRPILSSPIEPFDGKIPLVVWIAIIFYLSVGTFIIFDEILRWKKFYKKKGEEK